MVIIKIFIEGGIVPHINDNAQTIINSERLREAFKKLFRNAIDENEFRLEIELSGGYEKAIENFKLNYSLNSLLLVDLDDLENLRQDKIIFFDLIGFEDSSFFMIQKMESWILSQLEEIDEYLFNNFKKNTSNKISIDEAIMNKDSKLFKHPDDILKTLIAKYFVTIKKGKEVKLKYGKLKLAPQLLEVLDIQKLRNDFIDVDNLLNKILSINNS